MTSLAWAAGRGHTEIVQMLIGKGAKVNTADKVCISVCVCVCVLWKVGGGGGGAMITHRLLRC